MARLKILVKFPQEGVPECQEARQVPGAASHRDPQVGLAAVAAPRQMVDQLEALQVKAAREDGWTWERIAAALGITRQSVHRQYASRRFPARRVT